MRCAPKWNTLFPFYWKTLNKRISIPNLKISFYKICVCVKILTIHTYLNWRINLRKFSFSEITYDSSYIDYTNQYNYNYIYIYSFFYTLKIKYLQKYNTHYLNNIGNTEGKGGESESISYKIYSFFKDHLKWKGDEFIAKNVVRFFPFLCLKILII